MDILRDMEDLIVLRTLYERTHSRARKEFFQSRDEFGFQKTGFNILVEKDAELFLKSVRMTYDNFKVLLDLLGPFLTKNSRRPAIDAEQRLFVTLYFLAQGCSLHSIAMQFRIGLETARAIVLETCGTIWDQLSSLYVSVPNEEEWKQISQKFLEDTGLPNCIGALDGKHIRIVCPNKSGSQYFNYKKYFSIVLLAVCDSNYTFTLVDVGASGSRSDGGVFRNSQVGKKFLDNELNIPPPTNLPSSQTIFPYYLVADAAFPLKPNIMKPFARNLTEEKEKYNKHISRARIRIEIAFGILAAMWRIFHKPIHFAPHNAKTIVLAAIVLHNFLRLQKSLDEEYEDNSSITLSSIDRYNLQTSNSSTQESLQNRLLLSQYLNNILPPTS